MTPVIDSHHHIWRYNDAEYGWINDQMAVLRRDYTLADLEPEMGRSGIEGAITVQARQSLEETRWLLDESRPASFIRGVVGWAPIASSNFEAILDQLTAEQKLVGLRHVVQAEPTGFLDDPGFNRGMSLMRDSRLVYDLLISEGQIQEASRFVDRHHDQSFVLDHIAKPKIVAGELEPWASRLRELAQRENVSCKISGLVTEADWSSWNADTLKPYLDVVVEAFGTDRLMAGSDWPVCLLAAKYDEWWQFLHAYFSTFTDAERAKVFGATASKVYRLDRKQRQTTELLHFNSQITRD